jgi:hypothetical protein
MHDVRKLPPILRLLTPVLLATPPVASHLAQLSNSSSRFNMWTWEYI